MNDLIRYKNSLKLAWGYNDYNDWPIKFNSIMHLWIDAFSAEFVQELQEACVRFGERRVAQEFYNPSRLYRIIHSVVLGMKHNGYPLEEQRAVAQQMLRLVRILKVGSPFNEDGRNLILANTAFDDSEVFKAATGDDAKQLHMICGILWSYTESIFFRAHDVTKEIHGLYDMPDKRRLLIREYLNLSPYEIWPNIPLLQASKIQIDCLYRPSLDVRIDSYNHLYICQGNYIDDLTEYQIRMDGKRISIQQLYMMVGQMMDTIKMIHKWAEKGTWKDKANKYAEIYWFRKRPLKELLAKDWRVPVSVRTTVENGRVEQRRLCRLTDRQIDFMIHTLL